MNKKCNIIKLFFIIIITVSVFIGCDFKVKDTKDNNSINKISSEEAKNIIDSDKNIIILDVRTKEQYDSGHIKEAVLLPLDDINSKVEETIKNKNSKVLIYCRSGNRSATAAKKMKDLGYTNLYDFGGINTWKGEIVK